MSRARNSDEQTAVQLFPFVAVLLCTMGSLLVLLVIITRSAKVHATEAAAAAHAAAAAKSALSPAEKAAAKQEFERIAAYRSQLEVVRAQAAEKLRQDQLRLSHLEDHMQRLRDQLSSLQLAAAELNSLEGEHYDDRQQAEREIERLQQLIAESRKTIDELRADMRRRPKSYAIVPYQGREGTTRRPIYIECRENEVILQPEGVKLTVDDFRPPIGPGNPLVAAIRAAREYVLRYESNAAAGKQAEPYPLIIVRPKGVRLYYAVREAIQSWDSEFGYELVEEDWDLKYSPADPQLASLEYEAAELARNRLRALAAAAPQTYGAYRYFGDDDEVEEVPRHVLHGDEREAGRRGGGGAFVVMDRGGIAGQPSGVALGDMGDGRSATGLGAGADGGLGERGSSQAGNLAADGQGGDGHGGSQSGDQSSVPNDGQTGARNDGHEVGNVSVAGSPTSSDAASATAPGQVAFDRYAESSSTTSPTRGTTQSGGSAGQSLEPPPEGATAGASAGDDAEEELDRMARQAAADSSCDDPARHTATKVRGKDWAIDSAGPGMIPIRRTIQIVVREDALAILPEQSATNQAAAVGREFPIQNAPDAAYENLLTALEARIKDWGMAGQGLYWRPVVEMKIGTGGDRRASDLTRLLKNSGVEVRSHSVARQDEGGASGKNR
jgi:hypothetical protein